MIIYNLAFALGRSSILLVFMIIAIYRARTAGRGNRFWIAGIALQIASFIVEFINDNMTLEECSLAMKMSIILSVVFSIGTLAIMECTSRRYFESVNTSRMTSSSGNAGIITPSKDCLQKAPQEDLFKEESVEDIIENANSFNVEEQEEFIQAFKNYSLEQISDILKNKNQYTSEALAAALTIYKERINNNAVLVSETIIQDGEEYSERTDLPLQNGSDEEEKVLIETIPQKSNKDVINARDDDKMLDEEYESSLSINTDAIYNAREQNIKSSSK